MYQFCDSLLHSRTEVAGSSSLIPRLASRIAIAAASILLIAAQALGQTAPLIGNHPAEVETWRQSGWAEPEAQLQMRVRFKIRNREALNKLLSEQQNPASPNYRHWLTANEFTQHFGPGQSDLDAVSNWLKSEGFEVHPGNQAERYVEFIGPERLVESGFHTLVGTFAGGHLYANLTDPLIPAKFAEVIDSIEGLDNFRHSKSLLHRRPDGQSPVPSAIAEVPDLRLAEWFDIAPSQVDQSVPGLLPVPETIVGNTRAFAPADLQTFYDETPLLSSGINGSGGDCIAVVGDSDYLDAAVSKFNTQFALPVSSITRVLVDGTNPGINGDEPESLIDLEWSHAVAPGAPQKFYLGSIIDGISAAVGNNGCSAINISFGFCGAGSGFYSYMDTIFAQAAAQGQSVFVSSGDQGAAGLVINSAGNECIAAASRNVNEMAASPNVTGVGGTQFAPSYAASGNDSGNVVESVWDESFGAGGGGASAVFTKPAFQSGPGVPSDGQRDVPERRDDREPRSTRRVSGLRLGRHRGDRLLLGRHEPERAAMGWSIQVTLAGEREPGRKYQSESLQPGCVQRGRSRPSRRDERNKQLRGCVGFRGRTRLRSGVGTGHHRPRDICARVRRVFLAVPNS